MVRLSMAAVKMNISLEPEIAALLRRRAQAQNQPVSRYLGRLIEADARDAERELMIEGYRELECDTAEWGRNSAPTDAEGWPEWESRDGEP
jgi:hypothetical protein